MPVDAGRCLDLLVTALHRQLENYQALSDAATAVGDHLKRTESVAVEGEGDVGKSGLESTGTEEPEDEGFDLLLHQQNAAFLNVQQTEERIASLRARLGEALSIDPVNLTEIRNRVARREDAGDFSERVSALDGALADVLEAAEGVRKITDANEGLLRTRLGDLKEEFGDVYKGKQVAEAYGHLAKGPDLPSKFLDKKR